MQGAEICPNLRHLRILETIVRLRTVTRAASELGVSQPAASQAVRNLERRFNAELLLRGSNGAAPTEAGALLASRTERAFAHLESGLSEAARSGARRATLSLLTNTQLRALAAVSRHGSFAAAARAEALCLPALNRATRELEEVVGAQLFEKTSFGVRATRAGENLARRAGLFFAEIGQAASEISTLQGRSVGETVIGAMPLARGSFLPVALAGIEPARMGRVRLIEGAYEALLSGMLRGEIDFLVGALRPEAHRELVQEHLLDDPLSILMRADHPLTRKRKLARSDLAVYPWIAPRRSTPLDIQFRDLVGSLPSAQSGAIECNSLSAARVLLLQSDRLMLLSDAQTVYERQSGLLTSRPHPRGRITRPIGFSFRRDWRPTPTQAFIVEQIRAAAKAAERPRRLPPAS